MPFDRVEIFNKLVIGIRRCEIRNLEPEELNWLVGALKEEVTELRDAANIADIVGQVDALIDLTYFAIGGLVRLGLNSREIEECFDIVHCANMTKRLGAKEERGVVHELDAVKLEGWQSPEEQIATILKLDKDKL